MKSFMQLDDVLEWIQFRQIRWNGLYDVRQVAPNLFSCSLGKFHLTLEGEGILVQYLAEGGFLLSAKVINKIKIEEHVM
ncbi:MAG: hypothetical protein ACI33P_11315 [Lysinibacillus sp.]